MTVFDMTSPFEPVRPLALLAHPTQPPTLTSPCRRPRTDRDRRRVPAAAQLDEDVLPVGDGEAPARVLGQVLGDALRAMYVLVSRLSWMRALAHCVRGRRATDDSGAVVGEQEWQDDVLEETGGDFLLIHVRLLSSSPPTVPPPRESVRPYSRIRI